LSVVFVSFVCWGVDVITTATMKGFNAMTDVEVLDYVVSIASDQHTNIEIKKDMDKGAAESE
jgi:hypothetical protein